MFAVAFALLDIAEVAHQLRQSAPKVAVIALVVAVLHGTAAALALQRRGTTAASRSAFG